MENTIICSQGDDLFLLQASSINMGTDSISSITTMMTTAIVTGTVTLISVKPTKKLAV
jgi:hypothetical protein